MVKRLALSLLIIFNFILSPAAFADCAKLRPSPEESAERIAKLKKVIHDAILTPAPHDPRGMGGGMIFTGNFDWHSAVHAHWALLSMARLTADQAELDFLLKRLTPEALEKERRFLASPANAAFEMPYGQAWLLLLLNELGRIPGQETKALARLRHQTESRLLAWLETTPFPDGMNPPQGAGARAKQKFRGDHYSWLFAYLLFELSDPRRTQVRARLQALRESRITPVRTEMASNVQTEYDFLFIPSVLALVDRADLGHRKPEPILINDLDRLSPPPLKVGATNAHMPGASMVAVWPHGLEARQNDLSCTVFQSRMKDVFSKPELWADDFHLVSHWVPQFMWMGLWLEMGKP